MLDSCSPRAGSTSWPPDKPGRSSSMASLPLTKRILLSRVATPMLREASDCSGADAVELILLGNDPAADEAAVRDSRRDIVLWDLAPTAKRGARLRRALLAAPASATDRRARAPSSVSQEAVAEMSTLGSVLHISSSAAQTFSQPTALTSQLVPQTLNLRRTTKQTTLQTSPKPTAKPQLSSSTAQNPQTRSTPSPSQLLQLLSKPRSSSSGSSARRKPGGFV
mmetsp:Transcript_1273/g.2122  ORF Transcript_1273/g.2122 Transcript_1273/m.2122 type:complete len:223 (+) Transcript_1273:1172-1840(+)